MINEWLEVSLTVDGELAEAVAEVLSRFAPEGVVIESTRIEHPSPLLILGEGLGVRAYWKTSND